MKRPIIAAAALVIIIIYSVSAVMLIKKENSRLEDVLDVIQTCCENNDMEAAAENAAVLEELWYDYRRIMSIAVNDDRLTELGTAIAKVRPYAEEANDELEAELESIRRQLDMIYKSEIPLIYNIL
ncbi:MAG: DUF4363 family protein [Oscillospiraceae bacterium]